MPSVFAFRAVQYPPGDLSTRVAPPYDVLDNAGKSRLIQRDPRNIVGIDLPHTPAKELGPPRAYADAADALRGWLRDGTLVRRSSPAIFAYRQSFTDASGKSWRRSGVAACVEALPFGPRAGGGILPHEETFSGPKEDRLALMRATKSQLSPIFGLHPDEAGRATRWLAENTAGVPAFTALTDDGTRHEVWAIDDPARIRAYADCLEGEDVFIADGHHRYTTGLNYLKELEASGTVPADHPARRCMMVMVPMSDPGLVIWPTHRVLGGMSGYSFEAFARAARDFSIEPVAGGLGAIESELNRRPAGALGLLDAGTERAAIATPRRADLLAARFADKPRAWRELDVAVIQYAIVEGICQPTLNAGQPVKWAFPHTIEEVRQIVRGAETGAGGGGSFAQLAVIVRPTPLDAVREISRAGVLMPQKSTFFYPKLATGLFMNPLE